MSRKKLPSRHRTRRKQRAPPAPAATSLAKRPRARGIRAPRLTIGIGASAGGLQAFRTFFANMPANSGMAFVLVQHLSPQHESMLAELLRGSTAMQVIEATDRTLLAADHVYVIPPNATLRITDGKLQVSKPAPAREHRRPVDSLFSSLAEDQEENAVCIILSGGGSDGTEGLKAIKEHGGLTLAQAEFDHQALSGMPMSAAATGLVDHVLPIEEMPAKLLAYGRHLRAVESRKGPDGTREDTARHLATICTLLRSTIGHDFSQYKEKTVVRRVQRRMQVLQIDSTPGYIEVLRKGPQEAELLFRDLLIGVTQFFRDPAAFAALETETIPRLFHGKGANDSIRVWVPACATGQEAYSIAIVLKEVAEKLNSRVNFQVFATDIDEHAVTVARAARYAKAVLADMQGARLERWFAADGDHFCPVKEIREMCIFSTHSVIKDPPLSKLDLISCRNLMIYLETAAQDRLIRTFHYALRPGGYLFLGTSENVTRHSKLFAPADQRHRIFQRRDAVASLPGLSSGAGANAVVPLPRQATLAENGAEKTARRLMEKHVPAYVIVDGNQDVLRFSGQTDKYLGPSPGAASLNFFSLVQRALRPAARAALAKALASRQPVTHEALLIDVNGSRQLVDLTVEPIPDDDSGLCVVAFFDRKPESNGASAGDPELARPLETLEKELRSTRERLEATVNQLETSNEEMKSANEEYQSVNEELQSTNEELETAKEEMQSVNEELQTVNAELNSKNQALLHINSDLRNLLDSTQIATLFLDRQLRIRSFTPTMTDILHVRDSDHGRPVTEIVSRLSYDNLRKDATKVMRDLSIIEREVRIKGEGNSFLLRLRPYRTVDNVIDGVVMTFVDVTERKRADDLKTHMMDELNHRVKNTLATVQSIATLSLKASSDPQAVRAFNARLIALSRTHNLLAREGWLAISLRDLLLQELEPYRSESGNSFALDGADIALNSKAGLALGMAIHELATNAAKYGALSRPDGQVRVGWSIVQSQKRPTLELQWIEVGGPMVEKAAKRGFGTTVIERGIAMELSGKAEIAFEAKGLTCKIKLPLAVIAAPKAGASGAD